MAYPVMGTIYSIEYYIEQSGWEFNSKAWKDNQVITYLNDHKQLESGYSFYSNVPEAVYILANKESKRSPAKTLYNSPKLINTKSELKKIWQNKNKHALFGLIL